MSWETGLSALAGGGLIGVAAAWLAISLGRVAGVSGALGGLVEGATDWGWRAAFIIGLIAVTPLALAFGWAPPAPTAVVSGPLAIVAGLLVGFGSRLGSGCTSGHGVCGLARLSLRSLAATATFMTAAALTVFILRRLLGVGA